MMKKFIAVFLLMLLCGSASAEDVVKLGLLRYMGTSEAAFQEGFDTFRANIQTDNLPGGERAYPFISSLKQKRRVIHFYNSLMTMLMGLRSGKVDEVILPECTGRYVLTMNSNFVAEKYTSMLASRLSFGFLESSAALRDEFNAALSAMKEDGTLAALENEYVNNPEHKIRSLTPETFNGAEVITVAVTGDFPPLDMFAGDGKSAGYSTAILTEIGRRTRKNIRFLNTDAGGRSSALSSGRADVIFWCRTTDNAPANHNMPEDLHTMFSEKPEEIILSEPYYTWYTEVILRVKSSGGFLGIFR